MSDSDQTEVTDSEDDTSSSSYNSVESVVSVVSVQSTRSVQSVSKRKNAGSKQPTPSPSNENIGTVIRKEPSTNSIDTTIRQVTELALVASSPAALSPDSKKEKKTKKEKKEKKQKKEKKDKKEKKERYHRPRDPVTGQPLPETAEERAARKAARQLRKLEKKEKKERREKRRLEKEAKRAKRASRPTSRASSKPNSRAVSPTRESPNQSLSRSNFRHSMPVVEIENSEALKPYLKRGGSPTLDTKSKSSAVLTSKTISPLPEKKAEESRNKTRSSTGGPKTVVPVAFETLAAANASNRKISATPLPNSGLLETVTSLMCWGLNTDNRLGVKTEEDFIGKPTAIEALKAQGVSLISSGSNTSSAVTVDGRLYTWGKNMINNSQLLGMDSASPALVPTLVPNVPKVTQIAQGAYHTLLVDPNGQVYSYGAGNLGQLGHGDDQNQTIAKQIQFLNNLQISQVSCGEKHSAFVTVTGFLYTCGANEGGQLGLGVTVPAAHLPTIVDLKGVRSVSCGSSHTLALTNTREVYAWGIAAALATEADVTSPVLIPSLSDKVVTKMAAGSTFSVVLTETGEVYTWGTSSLIGHPDSQKEVEPRLVEELKNKSIRYISAGGSHIACLTDNGQLYSFGKDAYGQLGTGSFKDTAVPTLVDSLFRNNWKVSCGDAHTLCLVDSTRSYRDKFAWKFLETQKSLVRSLQVLLSIYYKPLLSRLSDKNNTIIKKKPSLLQSVYVFEDDLASIFRNIEEMHTLHSAMLDQLDVQMHQDKTIGNAVVQFVSKGIAAYQKYQIGAGSAVSTLNRICAKNQTLVSFFKECEVKAAEIYRKNDVEGEDKKEFSLSQLLMDPLTIVEKYSTIVGNIQKFTPPDHVDHAILEKSASELHRLTAKLNTLLKSQSNADETLSRVNDYNKHMKKFLTDVKKSAEDESKIIEDQKIFVENLSGLKNILGDIPGNVLDIYSNTTKQIAFLKTELNTRNTNQFEKPFVTFMEKVEAENVELASMKKKMDESNSDMESTMGKFNDHVRKSTSGKKLADYEKDLETKKKQNEQLRTDFQTKLNKLDSSIHQSTIRYLYANVTAIYDHYSAVQKRMDLLRGPINDMRNFLSNIEREEWTKSIETRMTTALGEAWPVLEELRKESNPAPELHSFTNSLKEVLETLYSKPSSGGKYDQLVELLAAPSLELVQSVCMNAGPKQDTILASVVRIFEAYQKTIPIIKLVITKEVDNTADPGTLFRGNSAATKLMSAYTKLIGSGYLKGTLKSLVQEVTSDPSGYEVDPNRETEADRKDNSKKLHGMAQKFLDAIIKSQEQMPAPFKILANHLRSEVTKKFPDHQFQAVGGFIFLRFFCPAIMTPFAYGVTDEQQNQAASRSLILISKLLQNLASGVKMGIKEAFMKDFESFMTNNLESVHQFFDVVSELPSAAQQKKFPPLATQQEVNSVELPKLHKFIVKNLEAVVSSLVKSQNLDVLPGIVSVVVKLEDPQKSPYELP